MTTIPTGYTSVNNLPTAGPTTDPSSSSSSSGGLDQDAFLQLLVAQLKYQDPSSPVGSSQFMQQTATFTMVQQIQAMNSSTQSVLALQQGLAASSLVGKTAQYTLADGTTGSGTVTSASFGVASSSEPTVRIGDKDISLSNITTVGDPR
jgi:flagellar basal-body rod modification protein FlgD